MGEKQKVVLEKTKLAALIEAASREADCFGPVMGPEGLRLTRLNKDTGIVFQGVNTVLSPKSFFLPQSEILCSFRGDKLVKPPAGETERRSVLFGVRPCDARALSCLDRVFGDQDSGFSDPYYLGRRSRALIITLSCREPGRTCFCTSVGGSPAGSEGADITAADLSEKLLLEAVTDKGRDFLAAHEALFTEADQEDLNSARRQAEQTRAMMPVIDLEDLKDRLEGSFDDPVWEELARPCLGCGVCAYLCPTCHCFDISDEIDSKGSGRRIRSWDCCQYPLFTRHASGHNPRVNRKQRLRQRIMHKYAYSVENAGIVFCVGCGRCTLNCPANLDIREVLRTLQSAGCRS
jgi:sulfhydrogenase subunit beta (sulfur reductase)